MKKPLPLSDLADMLDACENSQVTVAIRAAFATPGADLLQIARALPLATTMAEDLTTNAFYEYALHESGQLATTSARLHHRAAFYRYRRQLLGATR